MFELLSNTMQVPEERIPFIILLGTLANKQTITIFSECENE